MLLGLHGKNYPDVKSNSYAIVKINTTQGVLTDEIFLDKNLTLCLISGRIQFKAKEVYEALLKDGFIPLEGEISY